MIEEGQLPDGDWMKTDEVAAVLSVAMKMDLDSDTIRRWLRRKRFLLEGLDIWQPGREYLFDRDSMLRVLEDRRDRIERAIKMTEEGRDPAKGG